MSRRRQRLSWYEQEKLAARRKMADPYQMNQDHRQPPHDAYLTGDPSAWAEATHRDLPDDPALGRNEVGLPNMSDWNYDHKDVDAWGGERPYDNADTFTAEDLAWNQNRAERRREAARRREAMQREASREVYASIEKKAFHCVRIAAELLPDADDQEIEDQAFDLMSLPDDVVVATALRIARHKLAEADDDDAEVEDVDVDEEDDDAEVEAMLRAMIAAEEEAEAEEDDDEEVDEMIREMVEHEEEDADKESSEDDLEDDLEEDLEAGDFDEEDFDVELDPALDDVTSNFDQNDAVLRSLFANTVPASARQQRQRKASNKNTKGVRSLGGRVKEAANGEGDVDLSKLWASDPDVSDIF